MIIELDLNFKWSFYRKRKKSAFIELLLRRFSCLGCNFIALVIGAIFLKTEKSSGGDGFGAAIGAALIGRAVLLNGILYIMIGLFFKIDSVIRKKKE